MTDPYHAFTYGDLIESAAIANCEANTKQLAQFRCGERSLGEERSFGE
ncbi:hypothetical protein [uncultured Mycobacterium sp.]